MASRHLSARLMDAASPVQICAEAGPCPILESHRFRHRRDPGAVDRGSCRFTADQLGRDEDMSFVPSPFVEEATEQAGTAFDQDVCHPASAQFVQNFPDWQLIAMEGAHLNLGAVLRPGS